ncbi:16S rRNA (cytosine(967)-C(5))-methyltransferase RsmB [Clostridium chauvoei]|uniref:16S rRNA (cytosine(967)-C(5))-methyltransferase n=2 Tax=Clostridium chauvoei TaxID=46867 RepID=S6F944_9CLOT|nr:16S rRNA (cytosine(967)-C(5))-methyltransferase RsmB [Clostridium chauvoei]ATD54917.1 16S rRNA (cytosine(967)-C(5))-methyltransferase [Clostridium chauvoei]ATD57404.1 16S rRNA (cytosine(967)-C(5))-methyltransferase [Clostridium chauvoei]MBX7280468.1 16S rRNA (cytosine(967)-C(5))-methyltransferase RsmB [Clostridium chauvoei]MBX7282953.1 16S rRNA (cytosine(967)-C(5))-methyltransferase RsmB [Clostridium chauvoei]MBX7285470.1 16S rRNA (cytosine(967)-C(5))-methyltransferase RsmB [Clostridium cha
MNSRKLARQIVQRVLEEGAYSNIVLSNELNNNEISDLDKGLITELVYGTLRRKKTLDVIIGNFVKDIKLMDETVLNILRVAIYQIHFLDKVPEYAACNEAVEEAKEVSLEASKLVNGILRNYIKDEKELVVPGNRIDELAYKFSLQPWMIRLFIKQYGEERTLKLMAGLNETPKTTVRVNSIKSDYDEVYEKLETMQYDIEEGYACPEAIEIKGGKGIERNELFNEGLITVQDESAMLVAPILDAKEGDKVLDLCAAPGGKTTHIAELLNNTGEVLAFDLHENKLSLIEENINRLGLTNVKTLVMDATKLNVEYISSSDKVLIDVPCSGLGIIRKKPEIKWNKTRQQLKDLVPIQREIMDNAWQYLKPNGTLVYSTCTLNKEENEENIQWFMSKHKDAKIEKIFIGNNSNFIYNQDGTLTILPNEHMDGFYIAKIQKTM